MKKLMIAAVVAMLGIAANAAAVSWSMTEVQASPAAAASGGWVAYVMDASTFDAFAALDGDKVAAYVTANAIVSGSTTSARGKVTATVEGGNFTAGSTVSSYMVLFDNANAANAGYYAYTTAGNAVIPEGGADGNFAVGTFANATSTTGGWQTTAVPEPTSGLLMLVGLAGLALRRRRV